MKTLFTILLVLNITTLFAQGTKELVRQYEQQKAADKVNSDRLQTQYTNNLPNNFYDKPFEHNYSGTTISADEWYKNLQANLKALKAAPAPGTAGGKFTEAQRNEFNEARKLREIEQQYVASVINHYHQTLNKVLAEIVNQVLPCQKGDCQNNLGEGATATMKYYGNYINGKRDGITTFTVNDPIIESLNLAYKNDVLQGDGTILYHDGNYENIKFDHNILCGEAVLVIPNQETFYFNRNNGIISGVLKHNHTGKDSCTMLYRDNQLFTMLKSEHAELRYPSKQMYSSGFYMYIKEDNMTKVFLEQGDGDFYAGQFRPNSDTPHGFGTKAWGSGINYTGTIVDGSVKGKGIMYYTNGTIYNGEFKESSPNGVGVYQFFNGDKYEGHVKSGQLTGNGVYTKANGYTIKGSFNKGVPKGKYYNDKNEEITAAAYEQSF